MSPIHKLQSPSKIVRLDDCEWISSFGEQRRVLLASEDTAGRFIVCDCESPNSSESPLQVHSLEDQLLFIRSGCYEFHLDGERFEAGRGSVVYCPRDVPYSYLLMDEEPGCALTFIWPGGGDAYLQRCAHEFSTGAPDFHKVARIGSEFGVNLLAPEAVDAQRAMRGSVQRPRVVTPYQWNVVEVHGTRIHHLHSQGETGDGCSMVEFVAPAGSLLTLPERHAQSEVFFVHKGRYELIFSDTIVEVTTGTLVYAPEKTVRAIRVIGEARGRLLLTSFSGDLERFWFSNSR